MVSLTEQIAAQRARLAQGVTNGQPVQSGGTSAPSAGVPNAIAAALAKQQAGTVQPALSGTGSASQTVDAVATQVTVAPVVRPGPVIAIPTPRVNVPAVAAIPVAVAGTTPRPPAVVVPPAPNKPSDGRLVLGTPVRSNVAARVGADDGSVESQLAKLADMDVSHVPARQGYLPPASRAPSYVLPDAHGPVPERNLPLDLDDGKKAFIEQLNQVRYVFHDAELFSQIVRIIMQELTLNPEFMEMVMDEDIHFMLRGMREAMGVARVQAASRKRAAPGQAGEKRASTRKTSAKIEEAIDAAAALGFNFSDD